MANDEAVRPYLRLPAYLTERLATLEPGKKITPTEFARRNKLIGQTVRNWANGASTPSGREMIQRLARGLKVDPNELLDIIEDDRRTIIAGDPQQPPPFVVSEGRALALAPTAPPGALPVLGSATAGSPDTILYIDQMTDFTPCPPQLAGVRGAYALYVNGESMMPKFEPRELLYVNPTIPARVDDYVVLQVSEDGSGPIQAFVKRYKGRSDGKIHAAQLNPSIPFNVDEKHLLAMHVVVGSFMSS